MAGVKVVRKVNPKMTQRARKTVRLNPKGVTENKNKPRKTTPKKPSKPVKSPGGRGLVKAGPNRMGNLLKRRSTIKRKTNRAKRIDNVPLPKTPVRLSKYKAKSKASQTTGGTQHLPGLSQLILRALLHCKHRGGLTMAELQQVLADGGYDVSKNNNRVRMTLKGLVGKETVLQRAGSYKLNKMNWAGEKKMKTTAVRTTKGIRSGRRGGKAIKASKPESKSSPARKPAKQARKSPTKTKKQAGKHKGRNPMPNAKKQRARKGKTTRKSKRSKSS